MQDQYFFIVFRIHNKSQKCGKYLPLQLRAQNTKAVISVETLALFPAPQ